MAPIVDVRCGMQRGLCESATLTAESVSAASETRWADLMEDLACEPRSMPGEEAHEGANSQEEVDEEDPRAEISGAKRQPAAPRCAVGSARAGDAVDSKAGAQSIGGQLHYMGRCKPCAFFHTKGCNSGEGCHFCHLCPPMEKQRRKRMLRQLCGNMRGAEARKPEGLAQGGAIAGHARQHSGTSSASVSTACPSPGALGWECGSAPETPVGRRSVAAAAEPGAEEGAPAAVASHILQAERRVPSEGFVPTATAGRITGTVPGKGVRPPPPVSHAPRWPAGPSAADVGPPPAAWPTVSAEDASTEQVLPMSPVSYVMCNDVPYALVPMPGACMPGGECSSMESSAAQLPYTSAAMGLWAAAPSAEGAAPANLSQPQMAFYPAMDRCWAVSDHSPANQQQALAGPQGCGGMWWTF